MTKRRKMASAVPDRGLLLAIQQLRRDLMQPWDRVSHASLMLSLLAASAVILLAHHYLG